MKTDIESPGSIDRDTYLASTHEGSATVRLVLDVIERSTAPSETTMDRYKPFNRGVSVDVDVRINGANRESAADWGSLPSPGQTTLAISRSG